MHVPYIHAAGHARIVLESSGDWGRCASITFKKENRFHRAENRFDNGLQFWLEFEYSTSRNFTDPQAHFAGQPN